MDIKIDAYKCIIYIYIYIFVNRYIYKDIKIDTYKCIVMYCKELSLFSFFSAFLRTQARAQHKENGFWNMQVLCVCVCVCVCVCICKYMHIYMHMYVCMCIYVYVYTFTYTHTHTCIYTYIHTYIHITVFWNTQVYIATDLLLTLKPASNTRKKNASSKASKAFHPK